jgi:SecD/SecF fusion protein
MKPFLRRIIICVLPILLAAAVVGRAVYLYEKGRGGFRLGVDLVGGSILVYEVDTSRPGSESVDSEKLAAALKRRIDPADLYNVTIRPVQGSPPRVEIILPTGGRQQREAEVEAWHELLNEVLAKWPAPEQGNPYALVPVGHIEQLRQEIIDNNKDKDPQEISQALAKMHQADTGARRALSGEAIEDIKNLIAQQGRLEFRILANREDDKDAIARAEEFLRKASPPDDKEPNAARKELNRLEALGQPPPPPRNEDGSDTFTVTLQGDPHQFSYSWVEVGKEELYQLHLNNSAKDSKQPSERQMWETAAKARDREAITLPGTDFLIYSRKVVSRDRLAPNDKRLGKEYEYFILTRKAEPGKEITGDYLAGARRGPSERGEWAVHFTLNNEGGNLFWDLTNTNRKTTFKRRLAIVLDGQIQSAPFLESPIRTQGQITGGFTARKVDELVTILNAGALPATLKPNPVSENTMGATLGEDTIRKGTQAVGLAFLAVLIFMVIYYRFAGMVACIALVANLLLTIAFMVMVNATFTLPGLAGLVLTLGMAVDANVLIYERLREERERGASLPLAIRNGYDRAFPTIIDTHLTSIFTAVVLYVVGNDQLKGFGISLTVGLVISLFTSLYMTRTMFDLWQSKHWLNKLKMMQLFHRPNINFMAIRYYWFTATVILTILGAGLFLWRLPSANASDRTQETSVLNIDFIGGTAYTGRLEKPVTIEQLRSYLDNCGLPDLSIEQVFTSEDTGRASRMFTVRTAERDFPTVQRVINDRLREIKDDKGNKINGLVTVELHKYTIAADNKSAELEFTNPHTTEPAFASKAQVTLLLTQEGLKNFQVVPGPKSEVKEDRFSKLKVELTDPMERGKLESILATTKKAFDESPQPERLENFDRQLAANTQQIALYAILASWAAILLYLWFRFGNWTFGAAAVLCLIHDLFFTLGAIAGCHYVHGTWFGNLMGIGDFKIDLPAVAALLTLVGYSVSDTIVVFDRIREVRGKNPALTPQMINDSVNQTLSRTVLSALTVWLVVIVLYFFGGEGVHLFAFVMVVGVIVGTYSSIYIASPLLLIFGEGTAKHRARGIQPAPAQA